MITKTFYIPVYSATLLLSALLLFMVQPMFGKMLLPLLGGTPNVWNTAMLFFQILLLAGYAYAHGTSRFMDIKKQAFLHILLLTVFLFVLPISIPDGWIPPADKDPTLWQLGLMGVVIGGPFFVLSGSAPLLQHWFAHTQHKDAGNPYFLYAASNLGSMSALLLYPFLIEPLFSIPEQTAGWAFGYGLLIVMIGCAALLAWSNAEIGAEKIKKGKGGKQITWETRGLWLMLAFVPSSLMLGVTTYITTDLASVPLLWIVPLALYVATFIIVFAKKPFPSRNATLNIHFYFIFTALLVQICMLPQNLILMMLLHLCLFFFTALMCHHELASSRPNAGHLTQFYLLMSLGGALGGFFNAIIAPHVFPLPLEYAIALTLGCFLRYASEKETRVKGRLKEIFGIDDWLFIATIAITSSLTLYVFEDPKFLLLSILVPVFILPLLKKKRWVFALCAAIILLMHPPGFSRHNFIMKDTIYQTRNFFGILRIADIEEKGTRLLMNGTTIHGMQAINPQYSNMRLAYYSEKGPLNDAFGLLPNNGTPQHIGVLGLGIGVVACLSQENRSFDFYEIYPDVAHIAEDPDYFTYLSSCGSSYKIILGDGRLKIAGQEDSIYDAVMLDVFSSDNIPIHTMTFEALSSYWSKLKEGGFIVMNISNRHMNLKPVLAAAANKLNVSLYTKYTDGGTLEGSGLPYSASEFAVFTNSAQHKDKLIALGWEKQEGSPDTRVWTDQYSDIVSVLKIFHKKPD